QSPLRSRRRADRGDLGYILQQERTKVGDDLGLSAQRLCGGIETEPDDCVCRAVFWIGLRCYDVKISNAVCNRFRIFKGDPERDIFELADLLACLIKLHPDHRGIAIIGYKQYTIPICEALHT